MLGSSCFFKDFFQRLFFSETAKYNRMSQPGGSKWVPLSVGGYGRSAIHAAFGEGGADGWWSQPQGLACGIAW